MSRIHDALRRAEQMLEEAGQGQGQEPPPRRPAPESRSLIIPETGVLTETAPIEMGNSVSGSAIVIRPETRELQIDWRGFLARCKSIPFRPAPEAHLIDLDRPHEVPGEEFRSLRTRLNHMQGQQDLHCIVVSSASPAEGKTFTAVNLALAQAQLESPVLLADLDLRRPVIHNMFQCERVPGFSDFLLGEKPLEECIRRIEGTNLYLLPAGTQVKNPLELLNMRHVKHILDSFRKVFNWIILDTPPLLFSADANLLATLTDGIVIVVRIGSTTYDNVIRAMQSLCENNVLGIVANGARAGELYSKYTYYYTRSDDVPREEDDDEDDDDDDETSSRRSGVRTLSGKDDDDDEDEDDDDDDDDEDERPATVVVDKKEQQRLQKEAEKQRKEAEKREKERIKAEQKAAKEAAKAAKRKADEDEDEEDDE